MITEFVPIALFITIGAVIWLMVFYAYKSKLALQHTIQKALDNGQALSPDSIEKILQAQHNPQADLKRGILLVSIAIAIALFAWVGGADADIAALAMFPLALGIGYLCVAKLTNKTVS